MGYTETHNPLMYPMAKKRMFRSKQSLRTGTLVVIGMLAVGVSYAAATTDLAYNAQSLMAAVVGGVDTTPRLTIARGAYTQEGEIWPGPDKVLAQFDVSPKYLTSYGYLRTVSATVHVDSSTAGLYVGNIGMRYVSCKGGTCSEQAIPVGASGHSSNSAGHTYSFNTLVTDKFQKFPEVGASTTGQILITGTPYYGTIYSTTTEPTARVKAQIETATGAGQTSCANVGGVKKCKYGSVPVYTTLAYGNWLKIKRGDGYAYGYWDINSNGTLAVSDANLLLKVAVNAIACPLFKKCDINGSGTVTSVDAQQLLKYSVGSLPPPGTVFSTIDLITPNGGENLPIGSTHNIRWTTTDFPTNTNVYIELRPWSGSHDVQTSKIAVVSAATSTYAWTVPNVPPGDYRVEVYKADSSGVVDQYNGAKDISQSSFKIIKFVEL